MAGVSNKKASIRDTIRPHIKKERKSLKQETMT